MLMISEDNFSRDFNELDFPKYYINKSHPEDYSLSKVPVKELIFHKKLRHNRILLRMSFKINENLTITLVCDTGAPSSFYLCEKTKSLIAYGDIKTSEDLGIEYIKIDGKKMLIDTIPYNHSDINILGLNGIDHFGMTIFNGTFEFLNLPEFF